VIHTIDHHRNRCRDGLSGIGPFDAHSVRDATRLQESYNKKILDLFYFSLLHNSFPPTTFAFLFLGGLETVHCGKWVFFTCDTPCALLPTIISSLWPHSLSSV
jgi:hypothetical protein